MVSSKILSRLSIVVLSLSLMVIQGCDLTSTDGPKRSDFDIQFAVASPQSAPSASYNFVSSQPDSLVIEGSNGTLTVHDIHFIVNEFKLERDDDGCGSLEEGEKDDGESDEKGDNQEGENDDDDGEDNGEQEREECEEKFETSGIFVDLPLDGTAIDAVSGSIPEGTYSEMKFEVEDIDFDEEGDDDEGDDRGRQSLIDSVKAKFPNWPDDASLVVSGRFQESGVDTSRFFQTFVEAEIKVEREFDPPLTVTGDDIPKALKISLHPDIWFKNSDGTIRDLSEYDYSRSGELLKLEVKFEDGFGKIEIEEEWDDDDEEEDDGDDEEDDDDDKDEEKDDDEKDDNEE